MSDHTKEPWFVFGNGHCVGGPFTPKEGDDPTQTTAGIAMCAMRLRTAEETAANTARIVAAVNFVEGTSTENLEPGGLRAMIVAAEELRQQRDALLAVALAYERWEAAFILSNLPSSGGDLERPVLTQAVVERLIEIQSMRKAAVVLAKGHS